jgi:hypothetical protein
MRDLVRSLRFVTKSKYVPTVGRDGPHLYISMTGYGREKRSLETENEWKISPKPLVIPLGSIYTVKLFIVFYSVPEGVGLFRYHNNKALFFLLLFQNT